VAGQQNAAAETATAVSPGRSRGRSIRGLALSLASLLVATGLAEAGLRLAGFSWHLEPERIQFGWPRSLGTLEERYQPDPDLIWSRRDRERALARARAERPDVVFLGDSCTELSDWPERVVALLDAGRPGRAWRGLSFGTAGWTTYQGAVAFERDVLPVSPRVVTIEFGWNDHWLAFGLPDRQLALVLSDRWWNRLRLVQLAEKGWLGARMNSGPIARVRVSLPEFRANLTRMVRAARRSGVTPLLLTAPSGHVPGAEPAYMRGRFIARLEDLVPLHRAYVDAVRDVARRERAPLCDVAAEFERIGPARRRALFQRDGIHLDGRGAARMARVVYGCLDAGGGLPSWYAARTQGESARSQNRSLRR
jgi:lysophospholipase L1-like esterase